MKSRRRAGGSLYQRHPMPSETLRSVSSSDSMCGGVGSAASLCRRADGRVCHGSSTAICPACLERKPCCHFANAGRSFTSLPCIQAPRFDILDTQLQWRSRLAGLLLPRKPGSVIRCKCSSVIEPCLLKERHTISSSCPASPAPSSLAYFTYYMWPFTPQ